MIKPFNSSWLPNLPMQAVQWFQELYDRLKGSAEIKAQNDVTASRDIGTVYRNTSGKPMFVSATLYNATDPGLSSFFAETDATATPTTRVARNDSYLNVTVTQLCFWVLPGNYYEVTGPANGYVVYWTEWL